MEGRWEDYDALNNQQIELAYSRKSPNISINYKGNYHNITFHMMKAIYSSGFFSRLAMSVRRKVDSLMYETKLIQATAPRFENQTISVKVNDKQDILVITFFSFISLVYLSVQIY